MVIQSGATAALDAEGECEGACKLPLTLSVQFLDGGALGEVEHGGDDVVGGVWSKEFFEAVGHGDEGPWLRLAVEDGLFKGPLGCFEFFGGDVGFGGHVYAEAFELLEGGADVAGFDSQEHVVHAVGFLVFGVVEGP